MLKRFFYVFLYALPVMAMIALIPYIHDDTILTAIYVVCIAMLLRFHKQKNDILALVLGYCVMTVSEYVFVATGVETFNRHTFLHVMPLWLPFLWAYCFVTIKRAIRILDR